MRSSDWSSDVGSSDLALREARRQFLAHLAERSIAVRLEEEQGAAWQFGDCGEGCGDLVGVVGELVDDGDAGCLTEPFIDARAPPEVGPRGARMRHMAVHRTRRGHRGEAVHPIVPARTTTPALVTTTPE